MDDTYKTPHPLPTPHERELLTVLIEECGEVIQQATKSLRFGLADGEPGQPLTNAHRLGNEIGDVYYVVDLLYVRGLLSSEWIAEGKSHKRKQLKKFMQTKP